MVDLMLSEKVALITGAASGIGRAAAVVFARYGAKVALADVNREGGEATADLVRSAGGEAFFVQTDVSCASEVEAMVRAVVALYTRIDCAFNNAGIDGGVELTADYTEATWQRVIDINLRGVWLCMKYEIAQMEKQGAGAIVNTSSVGGVVAFPGYSAYVASKHGVAGLTRAAAIEYAKKGIRVNAVCPGVIRTAMFAQSVNKGLATEAALAAQHPIGRIGEPEEVGETAAWLCSDRASFIVGHTLAVDGGYLAQ